jgi:alkylhydroperoxidase family enzyme
MDRTSAISVVNSEAETVSAAAHDVGHTAEPYYDVFVAMQKHAAYRRLDAHLMGLVTDRAAEFAGLSPREQAAVAWVEAVISSGKTQSSDGAYAALRRHFDEAAIAKLTALAGAASARTKLGGSKRVS